ncbi:MAG: ABC transporter substrate-binding protein [Armatimonadetes bacterium]|nr:ABC transporter substrate-binding protein [Armatimonadota bacterium]
MHQPAQLPLFSRFTLLSTAVLVGALSGCKAPETASTGNAATAGNTVAAAPANVAPAKPYTGENLVIGLYGSLTGSTATFGLSSQNGIKMAFDEINAKNPPLGKKLELISEDNGSKTEQVPAVVLKLINQKNVLALLGEVASSRSLAAAPIAQRAGVPMVSPSSTNPKVTQVGDYIFRTCFIDPFQGTVMARFGRETLKAQKAAILTDVANDYSKGLTQYFREEWTKSGGKIVSEQSYSEGDKDFQAQLTKIKGTDPDVIFIPGYYTEVGNIAVQARRLGLKQVMLGGDGWDSPKLYEIGGKALQGSYFSNHYSAESKDPKVVKFVAAYKKRFGANPPDALAAVAYDAAYLLSDAIRRAGAADRAKIRDALAATKNFEGVTGTISIDENRNAVKPAVVLKVQGNQGVYVTTVKP